jgi:DNA-binding CsgD family transcriptional regulator/PAS domain-containing protein
MLVLGLAPPLDAGASQEPNGWRRVGKYVELPIVDGPPEGATSLSAAQLRDAFDGLRELGELRELADYPGAVARLLRRLVPCEGSSYNAVDTRNGQATFFTEPDDRVFAGGPEIFAQFAWQHPLIEHYARTGDGRARRISDFITRRQLHRTDLYNYIYKHIRLEHQLAVTLSPSPTRPREMVGLALDRAGRDFTTTDSALLELLRPHLEQVRDRLEELALLRAALEHASSEMVVLVTDDGTVAWATPAASEGLGLALGRELPGPLRRHLALHLPRTAKTVVPTAAYGPEAVQVGDHRVNVTLVPCAHPHLHSMHVTRPKAPLRPSDLRSFGLTSRQAEVLGLLTQGLSARQIADQLYLSPRTVEKHLAATYERLGVNGRAQAIVRALQGSSAHVV